MTTTKQCTKCNTIKSVSEFYKSKSKKDGLQTQCKSCFKINYKIQRLNYSRTKPGIISQILLSQIQSSKRRNHPAPAYTKDELSHWIYSQPIFERIYDAWVDSGYSRRLKPSVDRIENHIPYTMDNIQLMTWGENNKKGTTGQKRPVAQYTLDYKLFDLFSSQKEAAITTGTSNAGISKCCNNDYFTSNGFRWEYLC